jgi:glycosyltransferase involved in cell wall biosynthesis
MDDCSPDNTAEVVNAIQDYRLRHIRNNQNVGHLRNYNRGIELSRGEYVWLISADDRLRVSYVLERYVRLMDAHPSVGYVFCPGIGLQDGVETTRLDCGYYGQRDKIFNGRHFISTSLEKGYGLLSPSVMVRKNCYEKISAFPLDMPHQGDWYLWFRWALEYDVAYMSEPMVNYRGHDLNMMKDLIRRVPDTVFKDEVDVLLRTKRHCEEKGLVALAHKCEDRLSAKYARAALSTIYSDINSHRKMTIIQCDDALCASTSCRSERKRLRAKFWAYVADQHWRHRAFDGARQCYTLALRDTWRMPRVWVKVLLLIVRLGQTGLYLNNFRRALTWTIDS